MLPSHAQRTPASAASRHRLSQTHLLWAVLTLFVLVAMTRPAQGWAQPTRVFFGDSTHPVVSGEAWLIADRWGAYPGVLVATIHNGNLKVLPSVTFPQDWDQASDYKLLLAVADQSVGPPASRVEDLAYSIAGRPEYLKRFSTVYLSPPLPSKQLGRDWPAELEQIGRLTGSDLVLPLPIRRTVRLLYPDGKPLVNERVPVLLFGSNYNHCGGAAGINLGVFTTNRLGELSVTAPEASLALRTSYYEMEQGDLAGTAFFLNEGVIVGNAPALTVKKMWTLPQHNYVLHLETAEEQPIVHAHLAACMNLNICGDGCGPIRAAESDASGTIRFRHDDLREMMNVTVMGSDGRKRDLTDSEMHELLATYQVSLRWK